MSASLDGYVTDAKGNFDWTAPTDEVHAFVNDRTRRVGTFLLGRRMWEVLAVWDELGGAVDDPAVIRDFGAIWRGADKVVYSTTLTGIASPRARVAARFDLDEVRRIKADTDRDLGVGGPGLAGEALRAGLVDEVHVFTVPVLVGGGTRMFPDDLRVDLELIDEHRFDDGTVYTAYRLGGSDRA